MTDIIDVVVYSALLTWLTIMTASALRLRYWTADGMKIGWGNRDLLPEPTPLAARAERAARNTLENFVLFSAIAISAHLVAVDSKLPICGAKIFFWARFLYVPIYLSGILYIRTILWAISIVGLGMMLVAILSR